MPDIMVQPVNKKTQF